MIKHTRRVNKMSKKIFPGTIIICSYISHGILHFGILLVSKNIYKHYFCISSNIETFTEIASGSVSNAWYVECGRCSSNARGGSEFLVSDFQYANPNQGQEERIL